MGARLRILRPDDLVVLDVEAVGFAVGPSAGGPVLDADPAEGPPRLLVFELPPQHVFEQAYYDNSPEDRSAPIFSPGGAPGAPGATGARMAGPSRVVFSVPDELLPLPLTVEALLAWDRFVPVLPPASRATPGATPPIGPPGPHETALELPWRLILAPEQGSGWHPSPSAVPRRGRTELWRAALGRQGADRFEVASARSPVALRAVWSPDWRPPDRSWSDLRPPPDRPFKAVPGPHQRHQLVVLTSGFAGYEVYLPSGGGGGGGAGDVGERVTVPPHLSPWLGAELVVRHRTFRPEPVLASRLSLSALGASVRLSGQWNEGAVPATLDRFEPVRSILEKVVRQLEPAEAVGAGRGQTVEARDRRLAEAFERRGDDITAAIAIAPDLLALLPAERGEQTEVSAWVQDTVFGRDQYVMIAEEGALFPLGHRAVRITVMERRIERNAAAGRAPVANLYQYTLVVRRQRTRDLPLAPGAARSFPFGRRLEVLTECTPRLTDPEANGVAVEGGGGSFWICVSSGPTTFSRLSFACATTDAAGGRFPFSATLIFVPRGAWELKGPMAEVEAAYNKEKAMAAVGGRRVAMADPGLNGRTETTMAVDTLALGATARVGGPNAWVPSVASAQVTVPDIAKLSGPSHARRRISFDPGYVSTGFVGAEVWATVEPEAAGLAGLGLSAAAAGGVAVPEFAPSALSRRFGPTVASAVAGAFDPKAFFPGTSTLLGAIPLPALVATGALDLQVPKLASRVEPDGTVVTTLTWKPDVRGQPLKVGSMVEVDRSGAALALEAEIRRPPGAAAASTVVGRVNDLTVTIAGAVVVRVDDFDFRAPASGPTTVTVHLGAVTFVGPLAFLTAVQNKLAEFSSLLQPGPSGPKVSVAGAAVRVDESVALPPFGVAVFSLHDVRLTSGVVLPLDAGRAAVRFGLAERHHPFVLTVSLLGGGGFLELEVDTEGIRALDAALAFGGEFQLDIGVASGGVRIMAGISFTYDRTKPSTVINGFFEASGYVSVLGIVTVSVVFRLELGYDEGRRKIHGEATVRVSVTVCGLSKSVGLTVERSFGADGGDPDFAMLVTPAAWDEYAEAFA